MAALAESMREAAKEVDAFIESTVRGQPLELYKAAMHLIRAGGKRLRPFITLTVAEMLGGPRARRLALPLAAAVEVFHNFTLIHDDIMDQDEFRRGVPTVHKLWGVPMAILAGDLLFAKSFELIGAALDMGLPEEHTSKAYRVLAEAARRVAEGQALDMEFESRWDVSVEEYLNMIYLKTGALIEASAMLGAIAASSSDPIIKRVGEFGRLLGIAFQIRDDILGVFGDPSKTGKPVYSDLRRAKKTLLVVYALNSLRGEELELFKDSLGSDDDEKLRSAADLIRKCGALEYAEGLARSYVNKAKSILAGLSAADEAAKGLLLELADFVVERDM